MSFYSSLLGIWFLIHCFRHIKIFTYLRSWLLSGHEHPARAGETCASITQGAGHCGLNMNTTTKHILSRGSQVSLRCPWGRRKINHLHTTVSARSFLCRKGWDVCTNIYTWALVASTFYLVACSKTTFLETSLSSGYLMFQICFI